MMKSEIVDSKKTVLQLSQSNLQDFSECHRRFQLKVVDDISWPAAYLEPLSQLEQATEIGNKFHQLCHQFFTGIDYESLSLSITDSDLKIMWENFSVFAKDIQTENRFSEIILSIPFLGHQLIAKYDLILKSKENKFMIFDWKTSPRKPSRTILGKRYQTFLYPFILSKAGSSLFRTDQPSPKSISMNYWYPMSSDPEEVFPYSESLFSDNFDHLSAIISEIDKLIESREIFPLTDDRKQCAKCVYRSLCERGVQGGKLDPFSEIDEEDLSGFHFELDNINEIEY